MRNGKGSVRAPVLQFTNCRILRGRRLLREDLWVREGHIVDPEKLFFEERLVADQQRDCGGCILAPGFIDVQINGGFGVDFSKATQDVGSGIALVAQRILPHGVTSFCPTLVTSPPEVYHKTVLWNTVLVKPSPRVILPRFHMPNVCGRRRAGRLLWRGHSASVGQCCRSLWRRLHVERLAHAAGRPWSSAPMESMSQPATRSTQPGEVPAGTLRVLPQIPVKSGGPHGAGVLGVHLEGPFISREKRGAHPEAHLRSYEANAFHDVLATYGSLDNVRIVTLAPELGRSHEVIQALTARGICVSLGHSVANLRVAEEAVQSGATFITHLFNAMLPFHHRDPGIVGLLTSDRLPPGRHIFYGMISDGMHTNPAALRIAHRAHPQGMVLVTDAVPALGLGNGRHTLGQQEVEVDGLTAYVAGTKTLSGSIAPMDVCVRHFLQATGCSVESALEAASLHPAQLLGLEKHKGTLDFGADADFVMLDDSLHVRATYISGDLVWQAEEAR
ncbi:N-acetylglucosamine-6-phosphate deacetylase isoform X2 [Desmodus rotundus]|uniref:N-acetylglucosamine-6-phosphate deacetylase isoform X2 n=1 Tax=Desmodus rotundus TaxID=9430 RepID=UPI0023813311|nr:N-acetylglucosamine-6-phosphate deacetylase isoform X2 [Desmodus rotundus]